MMQRWGRLGCEPDKFGGSQKKRTQFARAIKATERHVLLRLRYDSAVYDTAGVAVPTAAAAVPTPLSAVQGWWGTKLAAPRGSKATHDTMMMMVMMFTGLAESRFFLLKRSSLGPISTTLANRTWPPQTSGGRGAKAPTWTRHCPTTNCCHPPPSRSAPACAATGPKSRGSSMALHGPGLG